MTLNGYFPDGRTRPRWWLGVGRGFCVGLADLLPAVSGGTVAYLLGFYADFLRALSSLAPSLPWRGWMAGIHWRFLIPFAAGWFVAALFLVRVLDLPGLVRDRSELLYSVFFGFIAGSVVMFFRRFPRRRLASSVFFLLGCLIGMWFVLREPEFVPTIWPVYLIAGFLAGGIMLLPGVSGSYFLFLIGVYDDALDALAGLRLSVLVPLGIGAALGVCVFSVVFSRLLKNETIIYPLINGLLLMSLVSLWPFRQAGSGAVRLPDWFAATDYPLLLVMLVCFVVIMLCPAGRVDR